MTTWKYTADSKKYAEFEFNKGIQIVWLSPEASRDGIEEKLKKPQTVWDIRTFTRTIEPEDIKDKYDADLFLWAALWPGAKGKEMEYTVTDLDWNEIVKIPNIEGIKT